MVDGCDVALQHSASRPDRVFTAQEHFTLGWSLTKVALVMQLAKL